MIHVVPNTLAGFKNIGDEIMKKAHDVREQLETAINQAQKDINAYQKEIEMKVKEISKKGVKQVDEAISFIKSQEFANSLLQKVEHTIEPLKSDLKNKEQVIRSLVDTILDRAKEVRETLINEPMAEVQSQVRSIRAKVLKTKKAPAKKNKPKAVKKKTKTAKKSSRK